MGAPMWRTGRLLVAAPNLQDPSFHRTVVLVLEHSDDGALGVVLNRPTGIVAQEALPPHLAAALDPEADFLALPELARSLRACGGYSGWGAGPLEEEIADEAWIDCVCDATDVFCDDPANLWRVVLERQGGHLRLVARMPLDPSLN